MPPDEPNDEERLEQLPEDGETPFRPAAPSPDPNLPPDEPGQITADKLDDTHSVTDTDLQPEGLYDVGLAEEAGAHEPNAGSAVVDYHPEKDSEDSA